MFDDPASKPNVIVDAEQKADLLGEFARRYGSRGDTGKTVLLDHWAKAHWRP